MKKIILVTGLTGFVGSHLAEAYLEKKDVELWGTRKWRTDITNVRHIEDQINWKDCDITDAHSVKDIVKEIKPDVIHHLAAMSFVPHSWKFPQQTFMVNVIGSINFFEAIREFSPDTVIQVASSSETYGIPDHVPITEKMVLRPCSPYGVSKAAMDMAARQYHYSYKLKTVVTRGFNHTGPRRGEEFVCSAFAKQIAEIELLNKKPVINVGNLEAKRDFTDVRDMVDAYILSIDKCEYGVPYNISTGKIVSINEVLTILLGYSRITVEVKQDPDRMRPSDLHTLQGNAQKFIDITNWRPKHSLDKTLLDLLNYWRKILKK